MEAPSEKRRHPRHPMPLVEMLVEAPALSEAPLVPEDVSVGGFKVVAARRPEPGAEYEVKIRVSNQAFERCRARVTWTQEATQNPGTWSISMQLLLGEETRERFARALEDLSVRRGPGPR